MLRYRKSRELQRSARKAFSMACSNKIVCVGIQWHKDCLCIFDPIMGKLFYPEQKVCEGNILSMHPQQRIPRPRMQRPDLQVQLVSWAISFFHSHVGQRSGLCSRRTRWLLQLHQSATFFRFARWSGPHSPLTKAMIRKPQTSYICVVCELPFHRSVWRLWMWNCARSLSLRRSRILSIL